MSALAFNNSTTETSFRFRFSVHTLYNREHKGVEKIYRDDV